jgi:hypothetical protein
VAAGAKAGVRAAGAFFLALGVAGAVSAGGIPPPASGAAGARAGPASRPPDAAVRAPYSWDWVGRPAAPGPKRCWQRRKSGRVAMVSSFLVPGLGQMYNEREFWAAVAAGVEFYFIGNWIVEQRLTNRYRATVNANPDDQEARVLFELHRDNRIQSTWLLGVSMLISGLHAFVDASLHDFDDSPLPVQVGALRSGDPGAMFVIRF